MDKTGTSLTTALISYTAGDQMPNLVESTLSAHDQITFLLQCIAFTVTIIAGLFTIYFSIKKARDGNKTTRTTDNSNT
jgi:low temperature requirement protein LtrA